MQDKVVQMLKVMTPVLGATALWHTAISCSTSSWPLKGVSEGEGSVAWLSVPPKPRHSPSRQCLSPASCCCLSFAKLLLKLCTLGRTSRQALRRAAYLSADCASLTTSKLLFALSSASVCEWPLSERQRLLLILSQHARHSLSVYYFLAFFYSIQPLSTFYDYSSDSLFITLLILLKCHWVCQLGSWQLYCEQLATIFCWSFLTTHIQLSNSLISNLHLYPSLNESCL